MNIKLLDCTLRDGGYINDWNFGNSVIKYMMHRYINAGMDIVEVGFLDDRRIVDLNRTIFPTTDALNRVYEGIDKKNTTLVAMIDYGTCAIDNIGPKSESIIDGIRIIFKKPNMYKAVEFGRQLIEKGYFVCLQLVSVTSYEDRDILDFCEAANKINPFAVSIVDTYGLMHKEQMKHYFELLEHNLAPQIAIGYHSHNNFQLAYSNTIEILGLDTERTVILDGSAYGMGKSAGNAPIELLAMHLNSNYGKEYDINQILEIIDTAIMPIHKTSPWGYALLYYLAAANNCHPSYINFLLEKSTLSVESINKIVKKIEPEKKLNYDKEHIKDLYNEYQNVRFDDACALEEIKEKYTNKDILLLGPGSSISSENDTIVDYINSNDVEVMAINFIPKKIQTETLFIGNSKRYGTMLEELLTVGKEKTIIATSNVSAVNDEFDYVINSERLVDDRDAIIDNSFAMVLNLLRIVKPKSVVLAGFDGYDSSSEYGKYCNESFAYSSDYERLAKVNNQLAEKVSELKEELNISFLTKSKYEVIE